MTFDNTIPTSDETVDPADLMTEIMEKPAAIDDSEKCRCEHCQYGGRKRGTVSS